MTKRGNELENWRGVTYEWPIAKTICLKPRDRMTIGGIQQLRKQGGMGGGLISHMSISK